MDDIAIEKALERVRAGDIDAFAEVVRACEWPLRAWVAARCPPEVDSDEVAHLAFIHAFSHLGEYQPGTRFRAWLWTIARHQLMSEVTRARRREGNDDQYLPEAMRQALERDVAGEHGDEEYLEALRQCVGGLAPQARTLVDRHYRDGEPLAEIAQALARSVASIKKALFLTRRTLEDCVRRQVRGSAP
jgi:RNA polymerase sigma-70 factor (ECF subfamily)